ncbi:hypothetical protein PIROE2DRAFT_58828 [Piromyces sp. E2]|nr:hypothetical protein PIROE2DRAFT_58828 [Piromyces sp. E2]|eukprot:OUM67355.1 hypothetical protein PIROE2DRAFT_58828 [Piromyces sp. E2]
MGKKIDIKDNTNVSSNENKNENKNEINIDNDILSEQENELEEKDNKLEVRPKEDKENSKVSENVNETSDDTINIESKVGNDINIIKGDIINENTIVDNNDNENINGNEESNDSIDIGNNDNENINDNEEGNESVDNTSFQMNSSENGFSNGDRSDLQTSVIYHIVSCSEYILLKKDSIKIISDSNNTIKVLNKELIEIKIKNHVKYIDKKFVKDFDKKNIYLFKAELGIKNEEEKFYVSIKYNNQKLISKESFNIQKYQQLFIYNDPYKIDSFWNSNIFNSNNEANRFIKGEYNIPNQRKFLIFENYLSNNNMKNLLPILLEDTLDTILNPSKINIEYILNYFKYLIDNQEKYSELSDDLKKLFVNVIMNIEEKKEILVVSQNNIEYNELINTIENYEYHCDEKFYYNLYLFLLLYYQNNQEKFKMFYEKTPFKKETIQYIKKHKKSFSNIIASTLQTIFNCDKTEKLFIDLLSILSSYNEYVRFICMNGDYILSENLEISLSQYPPPEENTEIDLLVQYIEILLNMNLGKKNKKNISKQLLNVINVFKMRDYYKLIALKEVLKKYKENNIINKAIEELNVAIHRTGKEYIENNKLENLEIINFIHEDAKLYYKEYEDNCEFACLISHIDLDKIDDKFVKAFIGFDYNYENLFKKQYPIFLDSIIHRANCFEHLDILYKIFNVNKNPSVKKIIEHLVALLNSNKLNRESLSIVELSEILFPLFKLISDNDNQYIDNLIKAIRKIFFDKEVNDMFILYLNNFSDHLNKNITKRLIINANNLTNDDIIIYLNQLENKKIKGLFLQKLDKKVVKEKEIFDIEPSEKMLLLYELIKMEYFKFENDEDDEDDDYKNFKSINYIKNTIETMNDLIDKLTQFDFSMDQMKVLYQLNKDKSIDNKKNLINRIYLIALGKESIVNDLYKEIENKINEYIDIYNKIDEIIDVYSYYFPNNKSTLIEYYKNLREDFVHLKVYEFPQKNEIKYFDESYKEVHEITLLKESKIFIEIFQKLSSKINYDEEIEVDDTAIFKNTKKEFLNLKNLFDENTENNVDLVFLEDIISNIDNDDMENQIIILSDILNIKERPIDLCEKLILLNNRKNDIIKLESIFLLLQDFQFQNKYIRKYIKKSISILKNRPSLHNLAYISSFLHKLNIKILNLDENLEAQAVINKMYYKPELITFLMNKSIDDIHQMGEFIDDSEDVYITLSDIDQLETCVAFIRELKERSTNLNEKEFLNTFLIILENENQYREIGIKFENSSGKYNDFYELFTSHLNPNELNKEHIKKIYVNSIFILKSNQCTVEYSSSNKRFIKDFDEMLDLRDVALLRKKDQREKDYFKICERFAEMISDIQEIIKLMNVITLKGYFEEIKYTIEIIDGISYESDTLSDKKNLKGLKDIIIDLNKIKKAQSNEVKDIYLSNDIIQLIYGRQFNYLYQTFITNNNNLQGTINNNILNNILKYITNNNHINNKHIKKNKSKNKQTPLKQMYNDVSNFLNELYKNNNIDLKNIYNKSLLSESSKRGIFSHSCLLENIERNAIYCSLSLTDHFPNAHTVLYCNYNTTEEEIISFIYRSVKCKYNSLFLFIKPERLSLEKKHLLIELLEELYSPNARSIKSCILFIYANKNKTNEIITEIEKLPYHKYFDFKIEDELKNKKKFPNVEIYSSENSGLGKSTLIKNNFKNENRNNEYEYTYFPLGGNIDKGDIIEKLLPLTNRKIALHLDLYDSNQIDLINEFLFSFLVLRYYSQNENVFYYGNEIKVKVEIPNSFTDYKKTFPIFTFFNNIHLTSNNMLPLIVPNDIYSNVQIVSNYLKYIEHINTRDIYIEGISQIESTNSIYAIPLSQMECQELIFENLNIEKPNYYQIESYIKILAEQFLLLSNSLYLNATHINEIGQIKKNLNDIRHFFVNSLTLITKHLITSSYDNILKGQNVTYGQQKGKIDVEKANEEATKILTKKETFSIEKIKPSMILINEDGQSISEIVTCEKDTEEYNLLKAIYNSDSLEEKREVLDYKSLKPEDFLVEVKKVLNILNPINENDDKSPKVLGNKTLKFLSDIVKSYVFTADNFIKLIIISLRLRTNIPVILMGETGCGKTSLIRIIAELKDIEMNTLNIHAGIEDKDIIQFIKEKNLFENRTLNKTNEIKKGDVWVFLDEINTCNSLGLITEIMLKHSCNGYKIINNVKFIAACNPYRLDTRNKEVIGLYDESKHSVRKLVYSVNPLPISLLNFVFDFGTPGKGDIKRYISNMVFQILQNLISNKNILNEIQRIAENSIFEAHEFIQTNYEISSVSLREIRRWGILYEWFIKLLKNPYVKENLELYQEERIYLFSLNLSIYLCYYIRIFNKSKRSKFVQLMKKAFENKINFESFPRKIQDLIATAVELEKGIAKNRALLENLFSIFVCLNTKIPLFIIGKPGYSKSLSAQLIFKSMNGKDSRNELFRYFPKVYTKSYQGSLTSNSKGVLKIFKKARNSLKDKRLAKEIISAIYFDEMGLAEISKNNPLKVIHSQLEYDENQEKISFIGISNWPLDASKMNRGIHLSIPEPDKDDLIETALAIAESYDIRLIHDYKKYFEYLALTYFDYKNELYKNTYKFEYISSSNFNFNTKQKYKKEFHGSRDFYHLIKTASKLFIKSDFTKEGYEIENILNESIERNFGGLDFSIKIFKKLFKNYVPFINEINEYDVIQCIENNIQDPKSRYLLIETKSSISHFVVTLILDKLNKNHVFYYGSDFEEDLLQGYYSAKILNKVQVTMSNDNVMILKNLTSMYPSIYDLFNQNFRKVGESNYARIALGNSNTQNYFVNDNFRCIVLLDKNEIDKQDPPFINRFEKHIMSFKYLLNKNQIEIAKQIFNLINELIKKESKKVKIDLNYELLNCDLEEIQGIVYQYSIEEDLEKSESQSDVESKIFNVKEEEEEEEEENGDKNNDVSSIYGNFNSYSVLKNKILHKIVPILSQDIIFYAKNSSFSQKHKEDFQNILDIYLKDDHQHRNIRTYLENIHSSKHIIYTFSNILDSIFESGDSEVYNEMYGIFNNKSSKNVFINEYSSERAIDEIINDYYSNDNNNNLCIFHFDTKDIIHLSHINYIIENNKNNKNNSNNIKSKVVIFIIHLKRISINHENKYSGNEIIRNEYFISHLTEWKQFFIDNLNGMNIDFNEIFKSSAMELINNKKLINLEDEFEKDLFHAFTLIKYDFKINFSNISNNQYIEKICEFINSNTKLKNSIQNIVKNKINNIKENVIMKIFTEYNFDDDDVDFITVVIKYLKSIYSEALISTLIQFERYNILSTKMTEKKIMKNEFFDNIYNSFIDKFDTKFESYSVFSQTVKVNLILGVSYPCIISIFRKINNYTNSLIEKYLENDYKYRYEQFDDSKEYFDLKTDIENNLKIEFERQYFAKILNNNNDDKIKYENIDANMMVDLLFKDYNIYYLSKSNKFFSNKKILKFLRSIYSLFIFRDDQDQDENDIQKENINIKLTFENITRYVLFIESYKEYIYLLCEFICTMDSHINNFINKFVSKISSNDFKTSNKNISYVNDIFYNLFESVVYCILSTKDNFTSNSKNSFDKFLNEIKIFSHSLMKVNVELRLTLKQILYLQDFVHVYEEFCRNGIPLKEKLQLYLQLLQKENKTYLLSNNDKEKKKTKFEPINEDFEFLKQVLSKSDGYSDLIVKLLNNKIKISKSTEYRVKLLNILCSNDSFIFKSKIIFETILRKYDMTPINKTKEYYFGKDDNDNESDSNDSSEEFEYEKENKNNNHDIEDNESENSINSEKEDSDEDEDSDTDDEENSDDDENIDTDTEEESDGDEKSEESDEYTDDDDDDDVSDGDSDYEYGNNIGLKFLWQLEKDKKDLIIRFLNKTNNVCLDEVLLLLFDKNFSKYFEEKKLKENLILNQSFHIFQKCVNYIEEHFKITNNNKLGILYCISYIKYYCYHLCRIIYYEEEKDVIDKKEIYDFLNESSEFRKIIKIYILKVLNLILIGDYKHFIDFIEQKELFTNDFDFNEKVPCTLNYLFIHNGTFNEYKDLRKAFIFYKMENFKLNKEILDASKKVNLLDFYNLLINEEVSSLLVSNNPKTCNYIIEIINKLELTDIASKILSLFFDNTFLTRHLPSIQTLSPNNFEILLYAHKCAFICSLSQKDSVYSNLLSPNVKKTLNDIYIPGGEPNDCLLIESCDQIEKFVSSGRSGAIYMCSCYSWYTIGECGRPKEVKTCRNCGNNIGGTNHSLINRPGHVRIFVDQVHRQANNDGTRFKMLNELKNEANYQKNIQIKGFKRVNKSFFLDKNKTVRNIGNITYRILSFIFYSCILYNEKLNYLTNNDLKQFFYKDEDNKTIFTIVVDIWNVLREELSKKEIDNIQCFINMVMPEIAQVIFENRNKMETSNERREFEILCDHIIDIAINNYKYYYKEYMKNNKAVLEIEDDTIKSILQETSNINNLPPSTYPLIKYFNAANYPTYEKFYEQFNSINKCMDQYPVLTNYINATENVENIQFLENFHLINPFVNYMLDKYNNKISRKEAKGIKLSQEIKRDDEMKKLFKNFKKAWKKIYKNLSNYDCHGQLPPKNLSKNDCLAYFLNDKFEDDYGKYIATAYKDFITYQNEFLNPLIKDNSNNEYLYPYSNQIKKAIMIQRASDKEIVSLNIENDMFESFEDIIYTYSYRNYLIDNKIINYINYKEVKFDLNAIEIELAKILLPEKRLFLNEDHQDFITYAFEGFNQNECIILDFKEKIQRIKFLTNEEKANISNLIKKNKIDYNLILFNLQSLLLYMVNARNINGKEKLIDEINKLPKKVIKLDNEFIKFFENLQFDLTLNQLVDCYEYIEFVNYDKILKNVAERAKIIGLEKEQQEKLNKHFENKYLLINKKELGQAVRKFISRYLVSDRFKNFSSNIFGILRYKSELWSDPIVSEENEKKFKEEIDQLKNLDIKIEQSVDFYEKLGGERIENRKTVKPKKSKKIDKKSKKEKKPFKKILEY